MKYELQNMPEAGDTVLVGMSGGVDSTLVALLLKQKGCHVIGVTMSLWSGKLSVPEAAARKAHKDACYGPDEYADIEECRAFCAEHEIEYHVVDLHKEYEERVLEYFKAEYRSGRTPNPCIMCNRNLKFGAMLEAVHDLGISYDYFCTGHYASVVRPEQGIFGSDVRPWMIAGAVDVSKDQTYFLYRIPSETLRKVRFPLAQMTKAEVFEQARKFGLKAAEKKESQDFISPEYLPQLFADKPSIPGDIIDIDGHVLGRHNGIEHYTVGQRKGLGVSAGYPVYVHSIDAVNNLVVVSKEDDLFSRGFIAEDFVWAGSVVPGPEVLKTLAVKVKIRLAGKPVDCTVAAADDAGQWQITFAEPQRAVSPGQSAVLYSDNVIIGGGVIVRSV
ncbi:MAG: tRNA 2-thiouridine(34) synthase MnmA, partial [Treponemataceae bacterium]|nr:tRNA 2-thiouridine(34) synthase MnmA [Treponemataceae bacterium]